RARRGGRRNRRARRRALTRPAKRRRPRCARGRTALESRARMTTNSATTNTSPTNPGAATDSARAPSAAQRGWHLSRVAVRLCAAWLLTGALFKLFKANPGVLSKPCVALSPFALVPTFVLAISVELAISALAFLRPKLAWIPLALVFVFFEVLLTQLIASGAE